MENLIRQVVCGVLVIASLLYVGYKVYEAGELYQLEKAEHEVDTMTSMNGIYDSGLITTDDGNQWLVDDIAFTDDTEVTVIFQTYDKPVEEWEIVSIMESAF